MEGMNFAAIDIGTNAARLLIKNIDPNPLGETKFRKVLFIRYPLRLGMDVFSKGKIGKRACRNDDAHDQGVQADDAYVRCGGLSGVCYEAPCATLRTARP